MRVRFTMKDSIGAFFDPVMKLETDHEVIHVAVRYQVIQARVSWVAGTINIPQGHPGVITLHEVSIETLLPAHMDAVHVRGVQTTNDLVKVWHAPSTLRSNATTAISVVAFPLELLEDCRSGHFYADCFIYPYTRTANKPTDHKYSGYGSRVTRDDLVAWLQRNRVWSDGKPHAMRFLSTELTLVTDVMETTPLTIFLPLARPAFLPASQHKLHMPLTELLQQSVMYVTVKNPSDFGLDMELAIADANAGDDSEAHNGHSLFYSCDDDLTDAECLREWQDIAREAAADPDASDTVAPFFVRERVILHAKARESINLGPIYFFPSVIGEWKTRVFVRNQLTHLEAVDVCARSGLGQLDVVLRLDEMTSMPLAVSGSHTVSFPVGTRHDDTDFSVTRVLTLRNSGSFRVTLYDLEFKFPPTADSFSIAINASMEVVESEGKMLLHSLLIEPLEQATLAITFTPSCHSAKTLGTLKFGMREQTTSLQLVGETTIAAAFACRRARFLTAESRAASLWRSWGSSARSLVVAVVSLLLVWVVTVVYRGIAAPTALTTSESRSSGWRGVTTNLPRC
ncbi:hypothetical protein PINS_up021982 [Pythium insidiosum]|nr:hypothetical protein PINS_up021982 [Pythium insidiosum]